MSEKMIDFRLRHDGRFWIAEGESLRAVSSSLEELDRELSRLLMNLNTTMKRRTVRMLFDPSALPPWIRQYSGHYFTRIVTLPLTAACEGHS